MGRCRFRRDCENSILKITWQDSGGRNSFEKAEPKLPEKEPFCSVFIQKECKMLFN